MGAETLPAETQYDNEPSQRTGPSLREIAVARVCSANMCAERAALSRWISFVGKLILLNRAWVCARDRFSLNWHQRIACSRAADHFRSQLASLREISASVLIEELPKLSYILFQLAEHKIGPVAPQIFFLRRIYSGQ